MLLNQLGCIQLLSTTQTTVEQWSVNNLFLPQMVYLMMLVLISDCITSVVISGVLVAVVAILVGCLVTLKETE